MEDFEIQRALQTVKKSKTK